MAKRVFIIGSIIVAALPMSPACAASKNYAYDTLGRLVGSTTNSVSTSIGYDLAGNRTSYQVSGASMSTNTNAVRRGAVSNNADASSSSTSSSASPATYQSPDRTPVIAPFLSGHGLQPYAGD